MARFDLDSYATVGERLAQFHLDYPDGRITTDWENNFWSESDKKQSWVVKATIYLSAGDQANNLPKATGYAAETDGTGGANNVAALPNAETSAIGRALMVMGYSMNKDPKTLASREEMQKVNQKDYLVQADSLEDVDSLRTLYTNAKAANAPKEVLDRIKDRAESLAKSKSAGAGRGVSNSKNAGQ